LGDALRAKVRRKSKSLEQDIEPARIDKQEVEEFTKVLASFVKEKE
jgi:hypothetical protein